MVISLPPGGGLSPKVSNQSRLPFSSPATQPQKPLAQTSGASNAPASQNVATPTQVARTAPTASIAQTQAATPAFQMPPDGQRFRTGTERSLQQLEVRYKAMFDGIQLKYFDPNKIEHYIRMAEKRAGVEMSEKERFKLIQLSKTNNPMVLKLLAMELRIGIPKRLEQAALAALGELMLHRDDEQALQAYLDDPTKDDNIKAYVRTVLMMNKVERVMEKVETAKSTLKGWLGVFDQSSDQQQQKRQKKQAKKQTA